MRRCAWCSCWMAQESAVHAVLLLGALGALRRRPALPNRAALRVTTCPRAQAWWKPQLAPLGSLLAGCLNRTRAAGSERHPCRQAGQAFN